MRPIDFVLLIATAIALGLSIGAVNDAKPKPTPDCQCVDCTCDPCECGPVVVTPDEPEPEPPKPSGEAITYFFTMPACVPCEQSKPHINAAHQSGYTVYVVDLSRKDLIDRYGVTSWPTTVVTRDGVEIDRHVGLIDGRTLQGVFAQHGIRPGETRVERPRQTGTINVRSSSAQTHGVQRQISGARFFRRASMSACGPGGCG